MILAAVDPGHGGSKSGALSPGGYTREADLTLAVGLAVKRLRPETILTRDSDRTISYDRRAHDLEPAHCDLVIPVHCDSTPRSPQTHGLFAYHARGNARTQRLAQWAVANAPEPLRGGRVECAYDDPAIKTDGWKRNAQYLCEVYSADVMLLELGYLSNESDLKYMIRSDGIDECARHIIACINHYGEILRGV